MMKVIVYGTRKCPWTERVTDLLKERDVSFAFHDVLEEPLQREEMIKKSRQYMLPVVEINGQIIMGYDRAAILKLR